jgi:hypothetical protein
MLFHAHVAPFPGNSRCTYISIAAAPLHGSTTISLFRKASGCIGDICGTFCVSGFCPTKCPNPLHRIARILERFHCNCNHELFCPNSRFQNISILAIYRGFFRPLDSVYMHFTDLFVSLSDLAARMNSVQIRHWRYLDEKRIFLSQLRPTCSPLISLLACRHWPGRSRRYGFFRAYVQGRLQRVHGAAPGWAPAQ